MAYHLDELSRLFYLLNIVSFCLGNFKYEGSSAVVTIFDQTPWYSCLSCSQYISISD
jgi:hypothetical protein